jgi:hypothetical protein
MKAIQQQIAAVATIVRTERRLIKKNKGRQNINKKELNETLVKQRLTIKQLKREI